DTKTPRLHKQLMRRFQQSVQQADEWLTMLSTGSARARVARLLLYLQSDPEHPTCELFNREDVAAMLAMTPETASRVVAEMKRGGVITQVHSNLFYCNVEELTNIALN
ncbi:MAG: winged helix-turn-helix domain-containing protein, partial [Alphaproteobacteria bacterium]|nr:winged helix-turn-helix domain-containing protein [Alphaproteobacteria bacterium]